MFDYLIGMFNIMYLAFNVKCFFSILYIFYSREILRKFFVASLVCVVWLVAIVLFVLISFESATFSYVSYI